MEINQMLTWALAEATPSGDANMDLIMRKVLKYKALEEAGRGVSDFLGMGANEAEDLTNRNLQLEILLKKRQLGMDMNNTEDFERALNGPEWQDSVKGTVAKRAADYSDRSTRTGSLARTNPQTLEALYKEAHAIDTSPGHMAGDRRQPYFKTARSAVSSGKSSSMDMIKKFLGGSTHGSSSNLLRLITRR